MVQLIPNQVKHLWEAWDLRIFILASLSLQAFLILFAPFRRSSVSIWIFTFIWSAYLLADWVAAVTVGLISNSQGNSGGTEDNDDLLALWASFLLLHLGGPDTITSFSLEDNELWLRHLFGLMAQVVGAVYVFVQSLPRNKLWLQILLMFAAGSIKYAERTRALYLASLDHFGDSLSRVPDPGPEYVRVQQMQLPTRPQTAKGYNEGSQNINYKDEKDLVDLDCKSLLDYAYTFFEGFKGLIVGLLLAFQDIKVSRDFFLNTSANDAFKLMEVELSLIYEVLHTKVVVVGCRNGYIFRLAGFCSILVAFVSFSLVDKRGFHRFDVHLTYTLFIGAIILDTISVLILMFCDWTVVTTGYSWGKFIAPYIVKSRRWSKSVRQCNIIRYCLKDFPKWVQKLADCLGARGFLNQIQIILFLMYPEPVSDELSKFIFEELRMKSLEAKSMEEAIEMASQRGEWVLQHSDYDGLLSWSVKEVEYIESLLLWHIATELCYNDKIANSEVHGLHKRFCKLLADYAFYLLLMQPTMMATVSGNWQMVFEDTCAEAKRYFRKPTPTCPKHMEACQNILGEPTDIKPGARKGDSKSVLFDACRLAKQLVLMLETDHRTGWVLMSKVWVELLSYAAIHCRANVHAQQPSKGGELLTFIWLLMNHLGLGNQFYETNAARIKFTVKKEGE